MADSDSIKLCECGCGRPAPIATKTDASSGRIKDRPMRFISGHNGRVSATRHGMTDTRTHRSWYGMIQRCTKPAACSMWDRYGGRGIGVCERWLKFENFYADMGERPRGKTLDRINNDGNYEPSNCRWATHSQQMKNRARLKPLKAACVHGHAYDEKNTYINPSRGFRVCRTCHRERERRVK